MYKKRILIILLCMALFSTAGYAEEKGKSWKGSVTEADLVVVVNFLMNNKGKEIKLDGKKHTITGKEQLDIVASVLGCCSEEEFRDAIKEVSTYGKIKNSEFPTIHASVPADAIPEIDKKGKVFDIRFEPEARDFWMKVIKQLGEKR